MKNEPIDLSFEIAAGLWVFLFVKDSGPRVPQQSKGYDFIYVLECLSSVPLSATAVANVGLEVWVC